MTCNLFVLSIEPSERPGYETLRLGEKPDSAEAWVEFPILAGSSPHKIGDVVPVTFTVSA
jgi:hypothetical protein